MTIEMQNNNNQKQLKPLTTFNVNVTLMNGKSIAILFFSSKLGKIM